MTPEQCASWLDRALDHAGEHRLPHVLDECACGGARLWVGEGCVVVTQIVGRDLHAWLGGGSLRELLALRPGIEAFGRAEGCTHATLKGRQGWERLFRRFGYAPDEGELRKRL